MEILKIRNRLTGEWQEIAAIKGDKGDKGDTGETGPQGPQGEPGKDGTNGTNGTNGSDGAPGKDGTNGIDGTTFIPSVSADGDLSWTNDGGKTNPTTVNIRGPQGEQGIQGPQGETGPTGPAGTYTAGTGISIVDGVISVSFTNADEVSY